MKKLYRKSSFLLAFAGLLLVSQLWAAAQSPAQPPQLRSSDSSHAS